MRLSNILWLFPFSVAMPCATPPRNSARQSRRYSPTSTSAGPSAQATRRKALEPLCYPDGTPLPRVLADSDASLNNLTKHDAQKRVNQDIRSAVIEITGGPPDIRLQRLCRKNHMMSELQPMVGHSDYTEIGRYYSMVSFSLVLTSVVTHGFIVCNWYRLHV